MCMKKIEDPKRDADYTAANSSSNDCGDIAAAVDVVAAATITTTKENEEEEEERGLKSPKRGPSVNSDNEHERIIMDAENLSLGGGNGDDADEGGGDGGPIKTSSLHTVASDAPMKIDAVAAAEDAEATTNGPTTNKLASDAAVDGADAAIIAGGNDTNDNEEPSDAAAGSGSTRPVQLDRLDSAPTIPTAAESKHNTSTTTTTTTGGTRPPSSRPPPQPSSIPPSSSDYKAAALDVDNDDCPDVHDTLLTMSYNQDGGCLAVGTGSGFRICNILPFQETFRRSLGGGSRGNDDDDEDAQTPSSSNNGSSSSSTASAGGIAKIEMLHRTNLLALTGHATSTLYPPNKVYLYDDHLQRPIGELSFRQRVLTTKLRRDRIVVVLRDRVYVYNFSDLSLLDKVHTGDNALGLVGISTDHGGVGGYTTTITNAATNNNNNTPVVVGGSYNNNNNGMVLACPGTQRGQVRIELYGLRRTTFVDAHDSALGALALSVDGCLLATASERGTVVRLFDTRGVTIGGGNAGSSSSGGGGSYGGAATVSSSTPLREFRRGVDRATISCLTFSLDSAWLGCASDHGTVHVFQTHDPTAAAAAAAINGSASNIDGGGSSSACVEGTKKSRSSMTGKAMMLLPKLLSSSPSSYLIEGTKAYAQVRGVPHPKACAFIPDRERTISVAGIDDFGNGCILLAEFGPRLYNTIGGGDGDGKRRSVTGGGDQSKVSTTTTMDDSTEARRLGYHRFFKCKSPASQTGRRPRSKKKDSNNNTIADDVLDGAAYIDDTPVDMRMNHISIGDENEDEFVPIEYK